MEIICLLSCILSLTAARAYPRTGVNDDLNGVEGIMLDIDDYEDPEVTLFKLIARGVMPVYTVRDVVKDSKDLSNKNDRPHYQTDDIKKGLDTVIIQLQEARNKLESTNNAIYLDIENSLLSLENLKHHLYIELHNASTESPLIYNASSSTEQPLIYNASTDNPLKVSSERPPVNDAASEPPIVIDETVFAYIPAAEYSFHTEEGIDDVSSSEADKVEQGDKTLNRKKWSYKLPRLF